MQQTALDRAKLIFTLFDADGSGALEAVDFDLMTARVVAAAPDSSQAAKTAITAAFRRYWTTLAAELDTNRDGRISFDEFTACVLSPERFDGALNDFAEALASLGDPNGDGRIERPLFVALMTAIGFQRAAIDTLFDAFEPAPDDTIEVAIWAAGIKDYYSPEKTGIPGDHLVTHAGLT